MNDYLPGETAIWQRIEGTLKTCSAATVAGEIRLPIVETVIQTCDGEVTDEVEKSVHLEDATAIA